MTKYIVQGGHPLFGEVHISGAKNAAVAIIPAALLVDGVCRIENIPQISDVTALLKILEQLGANVRFLNRSDVYMYRILQHMHREMYHRHTQRMFLHIRRNTHQEIRILMEHVGHSRL